MQFKIVHFKYQSAFHVDPMPDIFLNIKLLCHRRANLEMVSSSHTQSLKVLCESFRGKSLRLNFKVS